MKMGDRIRRALKRLLIGSADFHQQCTLALHDPQPEVAVRLHGLGATCDVTRSHMLACATPFTVGIGFCRDRSIEANEVWLSFHQRGLEEQLLGRIDLRFSATMPAGRQHVHLFEVRNSRNYCLPIGRLWAHHLYYGCKRLWQPPEVRVTARGSHAMGVFFICPRPVVLVTAGDRARGNMFPMNLMGPIGNGYFAFALTTARAATSLVERSRRLALSALPVEQAHLAYELARNHRKERVDWNQLPFATRSSTILDLPVPHFALRITELQVETVRKIGSHTLFIAKILEDEHWADGPQFFMVHGIYNAWRQRVIGNS